MHWILVRRQLVTEGTGWWQKLASIYHRQIALSVIIKKMYTPQSPDLYALKT
jgi:hypothetical protein